MDSVRSLRKDAHGAVVTSDDLLFLSSSLHLCLYFLLFLTIFSFCPFSFLSLHFGPKQLRLGRRPSLPRWKSEGEKKKGEADFQSWQRGYLMTRLVGIRLNGIHSGIHRGHRFESSRVAPLFLPAGPPLNGGRGYVGKQPAGSSAEVS